MAGEASCVEVVCFSMGTFMVFSLAFPKLGVAPTAAQLPPEVGDVAFDGR